MQHSDYVQHDATSLADLVRRGEVHPRELLVAAQSRAQETQALNAIVMRLDDLAAERVAAGVSRASTASVRS